VATRPSPAAAARAAVSAAGALTRGIEQALAATIADGRGERGADTDGRKLRWEQHRVDRRTALTDGAIDAIRELGAEVGMDDIAGHVGVSKTVLYRYFTDKNDLRLAMAARFFESIILPRLAAALAGASEATGDVTGASEATGDVTGASEATGNATDPENFSEPDEFSQTRAVIEVYVSAVADEPNLYRFTLTSQSGDTMISADSEKLVTELLTVLITARLTERAADTSGVGVWAHALVGSVTRSVDWWMTERTGTAETRTTETRTTEEIVDYLTMFVWSSIVGIVAVGGSRAKFLAAPPGLPAIPTAPSS